MEEEEEELMTSFSGEKTTGVRLESRLRTRREVDLLRIALAQRSWSTTTIQAAAVAATTVPLLQHNSSFRDQRWRLPQPPQVNNSRGGGMGTTKRNKTGIGGAKKPRAAGAFFPKAFSVTTFALILYGRRTHCPNFYLP